jgi:hypothetical protein
MGVSTHITVTSKCNHAFCISAVNQVIIPKPVYSHNPHELVVRQSPAGKNMSMEAENIVEIHHQAAPGEDTADDLVHAVVNCRESEFMTVP